MYCESSHSVQRTVDVEATTLNPRLYVHYGLRDVVETVSLDEACMTLDSMFCIQTVQIRTPCEKYAHVLQDA